MYTLKKFKSLSTGLVSSLLPFPAFAFGGGGNDISQGLKNVMDLITGDIGTTLCTLAIIGVGFLWLKLGKIEKEVALSVILGVGVVYSATYIAQTVLGVG
ncbi:MAG: TrbC/VirB2 family protein [Legionellales bacterium]|nr:TrbC/VirB2 family protein [Legionellales bacterium]